MRHLSKLIVVGLSLFISVSVVFADLKSAPKHPDLKETPGNCCTEDDPDFVGYRYSQRVAHCVRNVSRETKSRIYEKYRIPSRDRRDYTIDHFIPLSVGGSNSEENLWPEHRQIKATRINLETEIYEAVRRDELTQSEAIEQVMQAKMNPNLGR